MFPLNLAGYNIQNRFGMEGHSSTVNTACATGSQAIGDAFHAVKFGRAPIMIGGAVESDSHPMFIAAFAVMKALATDSNDNPTAASRPFDASRAGFVLGEGAGMLVLEEYEHAKARGAKIYAEILGFGSSNDAYHPIAPRPDGSGSARKQWQRRSPTRRSIPAKSAISRRTRPRPRWAIRLKPTSSA